METAAKRRDLDLVSNRQVRQIVLAAVSEGEMTYTELARLISIDASQLRRALGLDGSQRHMTYSTAVAIIREFGIDPVDVGL